MSDGTRREEAAGACEVAKKPRKERESAWGGCDGEFIGLLGGTVIAIIYRFTNLIDNN